MSRRERALALVRGPHEAMIEAVTQGEVSINDIRAARQGVQLRPIPWGKADPALARIVLRHMTEANPPIVVTWNPITHPRLIAWLRSSGIVH